MRRIGLALSLVLLAAVATARPARAGDAEEKMTQKASPVATPNLLFEAGAFASSGDADRLRQLSRMPDDRWWSIRYAGPTRAKGFAGLVTTRVSSTGDAFLDLRGIASDGSLLSVRARRDVAPIGAFDAPEGEFPSLSLVRERVDADWRKQMPSVPGGLLELSADWQDRGGRRASLTQGLSLAAPLSPATSFASPGYRRVDDQSIAVRAALTGDRGPARVQAEIGFRQDAFDETLNQTDSVGGAAAGGLALRRAQQRESLEARLSGQTTASSTLRAGGSYRFFASQGTIRGGRAFGPAGDYSGTFAVQDGATWFQEHRVDLGATWAPAPRLFANLTAGGTIGDVRAQLSEPRALATWQMDSARSHVAPWQLRAHADTSWAAAGAWTLAATGDARLDHAGDAWSQSMLLADGVTVAAASDESLSLDHGRLLGELALRRPFSRAQLTLGAREESDRWTERTDSAMGAMPFGDRGRDRGTLFASTRVRPIRGGSIEADGSIFDERGNGVLAGSDRTGFDARLRASQTIARVSAWAFGALADDRHALLAVTPAAGVAPPVGFDVRTVVVGGGATGTIAKGVQLSADAMRVASQRDLATRLEDVGGELALPAGSNLRLAAGARWLRYQDTTDGWQNGRALLGFVRLGGNF